MALYTVCERARERERERELRFLPFTRERACVCKGARGGGGGRATAGQFDQYSLRRGGGAAAVTAPPPPFRAKREPHGNRGKIEAYISLSLTLAELSRSIALIKDSKGVVNFICIFFFTFFGRFCEERDFGSG